MGLLPQSRDIDKMRQRCKTFRALSSKEALARLLYIPLEDLHHLSHNAQYRSFAIAKKTGGERLIETPDGKLKPVLDHLNRFLSACYYFQRTPPAYGFVMNAKQDRDRRNIVTNARRHLHKPFLLNMDLKDFFHTVSSVMVQDIFLHPPFRFSHDLSLLLTQLTTYKNRLPMGTPTSPALSNFACKGLDHTLLHFAKGHQWFFTRYADDLSFSSWQPITTDHISAIRQVIVQHGFLVNEQKIVNYGENDLKEVTGLILADRVRLPDHFAPEVATEIEELEKVVQIQNKQGELYTGWVDEFKLRIGGKLNFIAYINGKEDDLYLQLFNRFKAATVPPPHEFGAYSWFDFSYKV
jgi:RNA-directed DNA polymerase